MRNITLIGFYFIFNCLFSRDCEPGYTEINELCFHEGDLRVLQKLIDNSYQSGIDLGCEEWDPYCGSPNPFMDADDSWMWVVVDSTYFEWSGDQNGIVEPLELGLQEWNNGRLTTLMCGAYIYCQLSGPIPEEINQLTEIETLRLEGNYLSGFIPETLCDLQLKKLIIFNLILLRIGSVLLIQNAVEKKVIFGIKIHPHVQILEMLILIIA